MEDLGRPQRTYLLLLHYTVVYGTSTYFLRNKISRYLQYITTIFFPKPATYYLLAAVLDYELY